MKSKFKYNMFTIFRSTLSLFRITMGDRTKLEKTQRDFLGGGGKLERKTHLVNWSMICLSREKGGLEIYNLSTLNKALLGKWNWRFGTTENPAWRKVIFLKYGAKEGGWFSNYPRGSYRLGCWKEIRVHNKCSFRIGNGKRTKF